MLSPASQALFWHLGEFVGEGVDNELEAIGDGEDRSSINANEPAKWA